MQQSALEDSAGITADLAVAGLGAAGVSAGVVSFGGALSGALSQPGKLASPSAASAAISLASPARGSRRGARMIQTDIDH